MVKKGDKVKVVRLAATGVEQHDPIVLERTSCFLGLTGTVETEPQSLPYEPEKGPLGRITAEGECWVEFDQPCAKHGDTGAVFTVAELELVEP